MTTSEEFQFAVMEAERLRKQLAECIERNAHRYDQGVAEADRAYSRQLAEKDQLLQRAAKIIESDMENYVPFIDRHAKWLADYESRNVTISSEAATNGDAQEEQ